MVRASLELSARRVVDYYLMVNPENRVVIITDRPCSPFALKIAEIAKTITNDVHIFEMEQNSTGTRTNFPSEFRSLYENSPKKVASIYMHHQKNNVVNSQYELLNMEDPIMLVASKLGIKHLSLPALTHSVIQYGICASDNNLIKFNDRLEEQLRNIKEIRITTEQGTDLILSTQGKQWVKEDKRAIVYGDWQNLPIGEVYTVPTNANGTLILNGIIGGYEHYGLCKKSPITFKIDNGQITDISSRKKIDELKKELLNTPNSGRIAELGFGTNFGIKKLIPNILLAEKHPGVHIAFGDPAIDAEKEYQAPNHTDMVLLNPTVYADGKMIMKNGTYLVDVNV